MMSYMNYYLDKNFQYLQQKAEKEQEELEIIF